VAKPKLTGAYSQMQKDMGSRIRWARQLVEPNRAAFARKQQVDRTTLHKIEDGDRAPSVFLVAELSHKLRVSTDSTTTGARTVRLPTMAAVVRGPGNEDRLLRRLPPFLQSFSRDDFTRWLKALFLSLTAPRVDG